MKTRQVELFDESEEYRAFVEKFKPKKTTDDCYTPPLVYEAVKEWACEEYGINPEKIVRPFWPGGDYQRFDYFQGAVVLDNPPFSILSKICDFYIERGIPFFLFAPSLTCLSIKKANHIITDNEIVYENGAKIRTAFVTSFGGDVVARSAPKLYKIIKAAVDESLAGKKKSLPKYKFPNHVLNAAMLQKYTKYGIEFEVRKNECFFAQNSMTWQKKERPYMGEAIC